MKTEILPLIAAVYAALITGYFSFVSLINLKEQKTSEFRQSWIDSLRLEISQFTSCVSMLQLSAKNAKSKKAAMNEEIHNKLILSRTLILLRINSNEKTERLEKINNEFLNEMNDIMSYVDRSRYHDAALKCEDLIIKAKPLLKEEWNRVKKGEISYKVIKYFSIIIFIIALVYQYFYYFSSK